MKLGAMMKVKMRVRVPMKMRVRVRSDHESKKKNMRLRVEVRFLVSKAMVWARMRMTVGSYKRRLGQGCNQT